jgi:hypothetical protein
MKVFRDKLGATMIEPLGREPEIFFDTETVEPTGRFANQLRTAARNAKMLLVVLSPLYLKRTWCLEELNAFIESKGPEYASRMIVIGRFPVDDIPFEDQKSFEKLNHNDLIKFYDDKAKPVIRFDPETHKKEYDLQMERLSQAFAKTLRIITQTPPPTTIPSRPKCVPPDDGNVHVLIAHTIEDQELSSKRKKLINALNGLSVQILEPSRKLLGETMASQEIEFPALDQCHLYVQLIHPIGFLVQENQTESLENLQFEKVAHLENVEKLIWCKGRVEPPAAGDKYIVFDAQEEEVVEGDWSRFEETVTGKIKQLVRDFTKAKAKLSVFLDYADGDSVINVVTSLRNEISKENFQVNMDDRLEPILNHISVCDGAIVVYGSPEYREKVTHKLQLMSSRIPMGRVYSGPPEKIGKDKWLPIQPAGYLSIDGEKQFNSAELKDFLRALADRRAQG